jgi:hypothetical protein
LQGLAASPRIGTAIQRGAEKPEQPRRHGKYNEVDAYGLFRRSLDDRPDEESTDHERDNSSNSNRGELRRSQGRVEQPPIPVADIDRADRRCRSGATFPPCCCRHNLIVL